MQKACLKNLCFEFCPGELAFAIQLDISRKGFHHLDVGFFVGCCPSTWLILEHAGLCGIQHLTCCCMSEQPAHWSSQKKQSPSGSGWKGYSGVTPLWHAVPSGRKTRRTELPCIGRTTRYWRAFQTECVFDSFSSRGLTFSKDFTQFCTSLVS